MIRSFYLRGSIPGTHSDLKLLPLAGNRTVIPLTGGPGNCHIAACSVQRLSRGEKYVYKFIQKFNSVLHVMRCVYRYCHQFLTGPFFLGYTTMRRAKPEHS